MESIQQLRERLANYDALGRAGAVLSWDEETYMPEAGGGARAEHLARLAGMAHDILVSADTGRLLEAATAAPVQPGSVEADLVRVARRDYDHATKVPSSLVAEMERHASLAHPVWVHARERNDFAAFAPVLERSFDLARELAEHLGYRDRPYDALLDRFEPGTTSSDVDAVFAQLKERLVPLVAAIRDRAEPDEDAVLHGDFDTAEQERFGLLMICRYGFDLARGRLDQVVHPFEISFSRDDVRITTRYDRTYLADGLFSTLHEAGHGMYEQGIGPDLDGTLLATGASSALHESQSRLWENIVGRSRGVWQQFYPQLQRAFPAQFGSVPLERFYLAINRVKPSFVRVDADEVTYNLHIMLRYEMEQGLLSGQIAVADAARVWNDKMEEYLGIRPPNDRLGILQDTHWADGLIGYFPTYSLGNVLSVQFFNRACEEHPEIEAEMAGGTFDTLLCWLREHVYRHGRRVDPQDLVQQATGRPITTQPYLEYLEGKFGGLYGLSKPTSA